MEIIENRKPISKHRRVLVVSDIDGTLVNDDAVVPQVNIEAIKKFTDMGGDFTIASGRRVKSLEILPGICELTTKPILACNGAWGYDYRNQKTIWADFLDQSCYEPLVDLYKHFDGVALAVISMDDIIYHMGSNRYFQKFVSDEHIIHKEIAPGEIPTKNVFKMFFAGEPELLQKIKDSLDWDAYKMSVTFSSNYYLECSAESAFKSTAIKRVSEIYGIYRERTIAVGDGLNDLDMLEYAGLGIAVDNAYPQVFERADARCVSNNEGAIADVIEHYAIPLLTEPDD